MKRAERRRLKENEVVALLRRAAERWTSQRRRVVAGIVLAVIAAAAGGGYLSWRRNTEARAAAMLSDALAILDAEVASRPESAAGQPTPPQAPGTYPSERAKLEAALPRLRAVREAFPGTQAARAATYHAAAVLAALGRHQEAEREYQAVIDAGDPLYARTARLGLADLLSTAGQFDRAITLYRQLVADDDSPLPADAVLAQLGRTYLRAGRREDARQTYQRIVREFPDSPYAADARRELGRL
ncbi:MAG TPA: tetratricopeptide repeat protein [Vicinamibacterales bacterium]|nr:tetratricopeptide repeat protein [Vicinamibacterales bacterium]